MIQLKWRWLVSLLLVQTLAGCGGGEAPAVQEEAAMEEAPAGPPAEPIDPETVGAIIGSVAFEGETPRRVRIRMDAVPACTEANSTHEDVNKLLERSHLLVNTSKWEGFSNTFIQAWMRSVPVMTLGVNPDGLLDNSYLGCNHVSTAEIASSIREL